MFKFTNFAILIVAFGVLFMVGCGNKLTTNIDKSDKNGISTNTANTSTKDNVNKDQNIKTTIAKQAPATIKPVTQKAYTAYGNFDDAWVRTSLGSVLTEGDDIKNLTQSLVFNISADNNVTGNGSLVVDSLNGKTASMTFVFSGKVQDDKFGSHLEIISKDYITDTKKVTFEETIYGGWYAEKIGDKIDGYLYNTETKNKIFPFVLTIK